MRYVAGGKLLKLTPEVPDCSPAVKPSAARVAESVFRMFTEDGRMALAVRRTSTGAVIAISVPFTVVVMLVPARLISRATAAASA